MISSGIQYRTASIDATYAIFGGIDSLMSLTEMASHGKISLFEANELEKNILCNNLMNITLKKIADVEEESADRLLNKNMERHKKTLEGFV